MIANEVQAPTLIWPGQRARFDREDLNAMLKWAADQGVSDIRMEPGKPITFQRHGRVMRGSLMHLDSGMVGDVAEALYRDASAGAHLKSGQSFSMAYEPGIDREYDDEGEIKRYRFRVNCANALQWGSDGPAIIIRPLPGTPRDIMDNHPEPELLEHSRPSTGIVMVAGATGEGKSDLLSGLVKRELQDPESHTTMLEIGSPIEHVYDGLEGPTARITQQEVPRHLTTYAEAIKFAVRGNYRGIVVTECREAETIVAAIQAAQKGHFVLLTLHGNSLFEAIESAISMCPANLRSEMTTSLAQALRLVVVQRLVWSTDGTRTPIREILPCTPEIRRALTQQDAKFWPLNLEIFCRALRLDFGCSLKRALEQGRVSEEIFAKESGKLRE